MDALIIILTEFQNISIKILDRPTKFKRQLKVSREEDLYWSKVISKFILDLDPVYP